MFNRKEIVERLAETLDRERFEHSLRVEQIALALGKKHRINKEKISAAALLHDYAKRFSRVQLLKKAKQFGLKLDPVRQFEPRLFHAELGAALARREFGIRDAAVLRAIARHTTGAPGMTKLEKIIYLADHIEEGRDFTGVKKLRKLAWRDLDRAVFESASSLLDHLLKLRLPIYHRTIETRNYYLKPR